MDKATRQREIGDKDTITVGAKVDSRLHSAIKQTAQKRGVSMSMIVEEALTYYVKNVLDIDATN